MYTHAHAHNDDSIQSKRPKTKRELLRSLPVCGVVTLIRTAAITNLISAGFDRFELGKKQKKNKMDKATHN